MEPKKERARVARALGKHKLPEVLVVRVLQIG